MANTLIDTWNGFLITAGLGTIGVLLIVVPLVIFSIAKSPKRTRQNDAHLDED